MSTKIYPPPFLPVVQSGFRPMYVCETSLLNTPDDISRCLNRKLLTVLVLFVSSKPAFDTLNQEVLLKFMGLDEVSHCFFKSFLTNRSQKVKLGSVISSPRQLSSGVPQGAILSPLLYTLYTSQFPKIVKDCNIHLYADDTQVYYSFDIAKKHQAMKIINDDIERLVKAADKYSLHINPTKTSALVFAPKNMTDVVAHLPKIKVGDKQIPFRDVTKIWVRHFKMI